MMNLASTFLRMRSDASVEPLPVDADFWQRVASGGLGSFKNEFLVTTHDFHADWPFWEMHPNGDEVVAVLSGSLVFVMEAAGGDKTLPLGDTGAFVIVPKGTWHTAREITACRLLFITAGEGTLHRALLPDGISA